MESFKNTYNNNIVDRLVALLLISVLHLSSISGSLPSLLSQEAPKSNISSNVETLTVSCVGTIDHISANTSFNNKIHLINTAHDNSTSNSVPFSYLVTGEELEKEKEKQISFLLQSGSDYSLRVYFSYVDFIKKSVLTNFILSNLRTVVLLN